MPGRATHETTGLRRRAALALSGLLVASLLAAEAHRVVALHAVCSKHGELIHVEAGAARAAARPVVAAFAAGDTAALEGAHGCIALLFLATAFVGPAPAVPAPACDAALDRAAAPPHPTAPHPVPLLLQAPKLSPPLA
jgi:outer membrane biosynthesis protein TonB